MEASEATLYPRYLPHHIPRANIPVTVVGLSLDVSQTKSLTLEYDSAQKKNVKVQIPPHIEISSLKDIKYIEVRGLAEENDEISMREFTDLKENFDLKTYNEMVHLSTTEFKKIFNYDE